jgi:hypothetical protein
VFLALIGAANPPNLFALVNLDPNLQLVARLAQVLLAASVILVLFLFPDGRFVPTWTRPAVLVGLVGLLFATFVFDGSYGNPPDAVGLLMFVGLIGCGAVQVYRYRRISGIGERQQTRWVVFGLGLVAIGQVALVLLASALPSVVPAELRATPFDPTSVTGSTLLYLVLASSICLAIMRYRLWDIDVLINRTLVYGALSVSLLGIYALVVAGADAFLYTRASPLVALIATCLVVERLEKASQAPDAVLPAIVQTVTEALKLPYAALAVRGDDGLVVVAGTGTPAVEALRIPLVFHHDTVGELVLGARAPGETFSAASLRQPQTCSSEIQHRSGWS